MPSSAPQAPDVTFHARVLHEDLTFGCRKEVCRVKATYLVEVDRAARIELDFVLPVKARVGAQVGGIATPVSLTSAASAAQEIERRMKIKGRYYLPDAIELPPLYQATATAGFVPGRNQISFEYDQPLGSVERDRGYFHEGRMVQRCLYVLWPLREWSRAKDFVIDLRIEVDRTPPSWWRRTFGHSTNVSCRDLAGQRGQVGDQLVYRATIGDPFPDYLDCAIGDDDLVHESAK